MKFPVKTCMGCGLDLTTAEPAKVKGPGEAPSVGTCPKCSAPYFLIEDSASVPDIPTAGPEQPEPESAPEPEPVVEPAPEPEPEPEPETPGEEKGGG